MNQPTLSVIIPTHLRPVLLTRALESINRQVNREQLEVVVVSDVTDRKTDEVCASLLSRRDIFVRRNGSPGPAASRNLALKLAQGRFVMFLDDDDAWQPDFCADLFNRLPEITGGLSYFNCMVVKESRPPDGPIQLAEQALDLRHALTQEVFVKNQIHMSCFLFERQLLSGLAFDTSMRGYEDWDFMLSVLERSAASHVPIACSYIHEVDDITTDRRGSSPGATDLNAVIDYLYVYRRHAAPTPEVQAKRRALLDSVGLFLPQALL